MRPIRFVSLLCSSNRKRQQPEHCCLSSHHFSSRDTAESVQRYRQIGPIEAAQSRRHSRDGTVKTAQSRRHSVEAAQSRQLSRDDSVYVVLEWCHPTPLVSNTIPRKRFSRESTGISTKRGKPPAPGNDAGGLKCHSRYRPSGAAGQSTARRGTARRGAARRSTQHIKARFMTMHFTSMLFTSMRCIPIH